MFLKTRFDILSYSTLFSSAAASENGFWSKNNEGQIHEDFPSSLLLRAVIL